MQIHTNMANLRFSEVFPNGPAWGPQTREVGRISGNGLSQVRPLGSCSHRVDKHTHTNTGLLQKILIIIKENPHILSE